MAGGDVGPVVPVGAGGGGAVGPAVPVGAGGAVGAVGGGAVACEYVAASKGYM